MKDDRRLPLLDAARAHLRVTTPAMMWLFVLVILMTAVYFRHQMGGARFNNAFVFGPVIGTWAAMVGALRAGVFHPLLQPSYADWLARTPWTAAKPLPRGPIHLVWFDGLVVGALTIIGAVASDINSLQLVVIYLSSYCLVAALTTLAAGTFVPGYLALVCLGFVGRFWSTPWLCGASAVVAYLVVYWGVRRSLKSFPWIPVAKNEPFSEAVLLALGGKKREKLGWPYERLLVEPSRPPNQRKLVIHSLLGCSVIAWWLTCLVAATGADAFGFVGLMLGLGYMIALFGMLYRAAVYLSGYDPPISFLGRFTARRLIMPGFDQAFLVFPLMFLAPQTVTRIGEALGLPSTIYASIIPPLVLFIALAAPPGLRQWRLTGRHRMNAAIPARGKNYVKVG